MNPVAPKLVSIPSLAPAERFFSLDADEPPGFVDLILAACECSDDPSEIDDVVDVLFERHRFELVELQGDAIASA